ncbi:MAG: glycoside hydrolase family 3 C-terminal domain-containing protein, partial [Bifidobacteriaceae bacterium]|nr:glycoside hydrolase family 3 C-terminal domain-containing protein [Bifidobacteriaceae bacterium]
EGLGFGIPANNSSDPRHGTSSTSNAQFTTGNTGVSAWPSSLGMAATFDPALNKTFGKVASAEYRALGIATALSPQIDIATDPRWGRFNGTFGEDPKLASAMSQAYVDGFQTTYANADGSTPDVYTDIFIDRESAGGWGYQSVNAMMKHWPGGGAGEGGRDAHYNYGKYAVYPSNNWAAHLIPFVDGSLSLEDGTDMATAVMPYYTISYLQTPGSQPNDSNDPAAKLNMANAYNDYMINGVLRDSYKFDGVVCTDWNVVGPATGPGFMFDTDLAGMIWGVDDHYPQSQAIDTDGSFTNMAERARMLLDAGVDQFGGLNFTAPIVKAYDNATAADKIKLKNQMRDSAYRLLKNIFRTGLFENPYLDAAQTASTVGSDVLKQTGYDAQLKSMVLAKNDQDLLPLDASSTKVYVPSTPGVADPTADSITPDTVTLLESYFGTGNVITDPTAAATADVALVFMSSVSSGGGSRNNGVNSYSGINLDFVDYTASTARSTSVAGQPLRDAAGEVIGMENRSYVGKTTQAATGGGGMFGGPPNVAASAAGQLGRLAAAKASGKPVVVVFDVTNPAVLTQVEPDADALLFTFETQRSAALDMLTGSTTNLLTGADTPIAPTGLLPFQFPKDMAAVEAQSEDLPRDLVVYTDSNGHNYDFGYGLTWTINSGVTTTGQIGAGDPRYDTYVAANTVPMANPINMGDTASRFYIGNRQSVTFDYGYKVAASDAANKTVALIVNKNDKVAAPPSGRPGYAVTAWQKAGANYDFNSPVSSNFTLTAVWTQLDLAALDTLLATAQAVPTAGLPEQTQQALQSAILSAQRAQAGYAANQAAVDAAVAAVKAALLDAISDVAPGPSTPTPTPSSSTSAPPSGATTPAQQLTALLPQITGAVSAQSSYSAATWAVYAKALANAQAVAAKPAATQAEYNAAVADLIKAIAGLAAPAAAPAKVTTQSVAVTGKAFKKATKPTVTVTVKLSSGTAKGKVTIYVANKKVKTVSVTKATTKVKLSKKYSKAIKVKASYAPSAAANGTAKTSKTVTVKVKK